MCVLPALVATSALVRMLVLVLLRVCLEEVTMVEAKVVALKLTMPQLISLAGAAAAAAAAVVVVVGTKQMRTPPHRLSPETARTARPFRPDPGLPQTPSLGGRRID